MATSQKSEHKDDDTDLDPEIGGRNLSSKFDYSASTSNSSVEDVRLSTRDTNSKVLGDHRRPSIAIQMPSSDNPSLEQDGSDDEDDSPKAATPLTMSYGRSKARLQEPPPMTLGMQEQIAQSLQRRRYSESAIMEDEEGLRPLLEETSPGKQATSEKQAPLPASKRRSFIGAPSIKSALRSVSKSFSIPAQNVEEEDPLENDIVPEDEDKKKENIGWMVIQWVSLILLAALLGCSIRIKEVRDIQWQDEQIWRWQALALVIFSGQLISGWIVQGLVLLFENHFFLKKRVLYFVYGLRKSVKRSIWLGLVIVVWQEIFAKRASTKIVRTITKVLWCLFTICTSWMLKVLAVKLAANSFHRAAYFDRIQDCLFNQYILERLSAPAQVADSAKLSSSMSMAPTSLPKNPAIPMFKQTMTQRRHSTALDTASLQELHQGIPSVGKQHAKPMMAKSANPIEQDKLQQLTSETVSAWTLKSLMKTVRKTNMSTKSSFLSEVHGDGEIDSEARAKVAAKQMFYNVARPGQKYLTLADFLYFLPEEKATRAFSLFETTEHGTITKKALVKWVVNVYKERRALALTLNDNKTVVAKLHNVLDVVLSLFLFIVCLLIMGIETSKLLLFFSSLFIPCVFVFGNSARTTFDALVFLFVMHPFDVGDRVSVEGSMMLVEEMNVLNTVFLGGTNEKIYYPNSILAMKSITNYYRSPDQWDGIEFQIHMHTPLEKLGHVKERMQKYIESQPQFWYPDFSVVCKDIDDSTRMKMGLYFQHHLNYQEAGERFKRRSNMLLYLKQQLEDLEIGYHLPRQEVLVTGLPVIDMAHAMSSIKSVD